ncbi:hypothetical protein EYS14_18595 [Alteromonadaceae bacterium M269]|nr:hypothetical protein EYS14_18595 [Alteromonadaceae bacterium M269]
MKVTNAIYAFVFLLALTGCGETTIDTKNSETMYETLSKIMKDNSEVEKKAIAQNIMLILRLHKQGLEEIYPDVLYDNSEAGVFIPGYLGKEDQLGIYRDILLEAPELLSDKSPSDLKKEADDVRRSYWSRILQRDIDRAAELTRKRGEVMAKLAEHKAQFDSMNAQIAELENLKNSFPIALRITEIKAQPAPFFKTSGSVQATITNVLDKPISKVSTEVNLWMRNDPDKKKRFLLNFKPNSTLAKDQESLTQPIGLNMGRMRNATNNINDWESSVEVREVFFAGESKGYDFEPEGFDKTDIWRSERSVDTCEKLLANLDDYLDKSPQYITELEAMIKQPKDAKVSKLPWVRLDSCE